MKKNVRICGCADVRMMGRLNQDQIKKFWGFKNSESFKTSRIRNPHIRTFAIRTFITWFYQRKE
jgi:hypothetical protein